MTRFHLIGVAAVALLAACNPGKKNVAACEDWLAAMECGDYDFSSSTDCSIYEETECDISEYFTCLTDNTSCDDATGVPDITGWSNCLDKAECA